MNKSSGAGTDATVDAGDTRRSRSVIMQELLGRFGVFFGLFVLVGVFSSLSPVFFTQNNLMNILIQAGVNAIIAAGMTWVILARQIDLSVGSTLALSSVIGASFISGGGPIWLGIAIMLAVGVVAGIVNGAFVAYFGFPAFVTTLATMWLYRGLAYVFTEGQAVTGLPRDFRLLATGSISGIPNIVVLLVVVFAFCHFVLARTTVGRHIYAVGDNQEAARLSGVNVKGTQLLVFAASGFFAALGGVVLASRLFSAQPVAGSGYELFAIAAVVIGGTSLFGGVGGVLGTLIGAVFIATLVNGLVILNVTAFWQQVFMGAVVLAAVGLDQYRKRFTVPS